MFYSERQEKNYVMTTFMIYKPRIYMTNTKYTN